MSIMVAKATQTYEEIKKSKNNRTIYIGNCMKVIPNCAFWRGKGKVVVLDRGDGFNIELYDVRLDPSESSSVGNKFPEVAE
jgi:hypothetical protein